MPQVSENVSYNDLISGSSGVFTLRKGWEFTRIYKVAGVTGDGHAKIFNAVNHPDVPKENDPHPDVPSVIVKQISGIGISSDIVELAVKYSAPDQFIPTKDEVILTIDSSLTQTETNLDVNGNLLLTQYTYPSDYAESPDLAGKTLQHAAMVPKLIPTINVSLRRLEENDPLELSMVYTGRINSVDFLGGGDVGQWMCTNISGDSQDGGETWTVTYNFQGRYDGWNQDIVFISSDLGEPPVFADAAELDLGLRRYQIYPSIDFNQLGL